LIGEQIVTLIIDHVHREMAELLK